MTRSVELKLYAYRKNRDGLIISFVVHPNDEQQLLGIDIGDTFDAVLTENGDGPTRKDGQLQQCRVTAPGHPPLRSDGAREGSPPAPEKPVLPAGSAPSEATPVIVTRFLDGTAAPSPSKPQAQPSDGNRWNAKFMALCKDPGFQRWLGIPENHIGNNHGLEWAVEELKDNRIEIGSRSELATNPEAQKRFLLLEAQYHAERGRP